MREGVKRETFDSIVDVRSPRFDLVKIRSDIGRGAVVVISSIKLGAKCRFESRHAPMAGEGDVSLARIVHGVQRRRERSR